MVTKTYLRYVAKWLQFSSISLADLAAIPVPESDLLPQIAQVASRLHPPMSRYVFSSLVEAEATFTQHVRLHGSNLRLKTTGRANKAADLCLILSTPETNPDGTVVVNPFTFTI